MNNFAIKIYIAAELLLLGGTAGLILGHIWVGAGFALSVAVYIAWDGYREHRIQTVRAARVALGLEEPEEPEVWPGI